MEEIRWKSDREKIETQKKLQILKVKRERELYNRKKRTKASRKG